MKVWLTILFTYIYTHTQTQTSVTLKQTYLQSAFIKKIACTLLLFKNLTGYYKVYTTALNMQQFYILPTERLCVLHGSQNEQRLLLYTELTDWFL